MPKVIGGLKIVPVARGLGGSGARGLGGSECKTYRPVTPVASAVQDQSGDCPRIRHASGSPAVAGANVWADRSKQPLRPHATNVPGEPQGSPRRSTGDAAGSPLPPSATCRALSSPRSVPRRSAGRWRPDVERAVHHRGRSHDVEEAAASIRSAPASSCPAGPRCANARSAPSTRSNRSGRFPRAVGGCRDWRPPQSVECPLPALQSDADAAVVSHNDSHRRRSPLERVAGRRREPDAGRRQ